MSYTPPFDAPASIFRAYDIRGVYGSMLTEKVVYAIGLSIANTARDLGQSEICMARDGRLSGPILSQALREGLVDGGMQVMDIGIAPTPMLYYASFKLNTQAGVMLTGSHNPRDHNGLKIILGGKTLKQGQVLELRERIIEQTLQTHPGGSCESIDLKDDYIQRICGDVHLDRPMKIVIDAGNGVAGAIAGDLYRALGCEVTELFCEVDGNFPNHHPNPSDLENLTSLIETVKSEKAELGLAFDGDADRLGIVSSSGEVIWADRQMILFSRDVLSRVPGADIVFDVKCSKLLAQDIEVHGGKPIMWKTGHSLVKAKLKESGAPLAGEMSGHIFFKERWYGFDDGLYSGARLLEILSQKPHADESLNTLPNSFNTPEIQIQVPDEIKFKLIETLLETAEFPDNAVRSTIDGLRVDFPDGWGLVRASNTTPCLTLRFEADTAEALEQYQTMMMEQIQRCEGFNA